MNQASCDTLAKLAGKNISDVEYGSTEPHPLLHQGQMLTFYFTDGTSVSIFTGTNIGNLWDDPSDLCVDLTAVYHAAGEQPMRPQASKRFPAAPANCAAKVAEAL